MHRGERGSKLFPCVGCPVIWDRKSAGRNSAFHRPSSLLGDCVPSALARGTRATRHTREQAVAEGSGLPRNARRHPESPVSLSCYDLITGREEISIQLPEIFRNARRTPFSSFLGRCRVTTRGRPPAHGCRPSPATTGQPAEIQAGRQGRGQLPEIEPGHFSGDRKSTTHVPC